MRWIKKIDDTFYDGHDELYHHAKFGEDRTMRAGCGCENVVLVFFLFCFLFFVVVFLLLVTLPVRSTVHRALEGCIVRASIALPFIARFRRGFQYFFQKGLLYQILYLVRILLARWRHYFREIVVKNYLSKT